MYAIYITDKETKRVLEKNLSKETALKVCEAWGWTYRDKNGKKHKLNYQEEYKMKDLRELKRTELREMAKELHIANWWNLSKAAMIQEIEKKTAPKKEVKKKANLKLSELTYKGETKSIREWAEELEMPWPTLYDRVNRNGWTTEEAIETPLGGRRKK